MALEASTIDILNDTASSSSSTYDPLEFLATNLDLTQLSKCEKHYKDIVGEFTHALAPHLGGNVQVLAVHKNMARGVSMRARREAFEVFEHAVASTRGGTGNVRMGWFGGSKEQVCGVMSIGFSGATVPAGGLTRGLGVGVYLSPKAFPFDCLQASIPDENGIRHMLLCRVILGNMEVVPTGSSQSYPSSEKFDSAVDNPLAPRTYVVWCANMNTHIFPEFVLSFKAPSLSGFRRNQANVRRPSSPWISFPALFSILTKYLDPDKMSLIYKVHDDFRKRKATRSQMIRKTRLIAGDSLLTSIIKSCSHKKIAETDPMTLHFAAA